MATPGRPVDQLREGLSALQTDSAAFLRHAEQVRLAVDEVVTRNADLVARLASAEAQRLALEIERDSLAEQLAALPARLQAVVERYQQDAIALVTRLQAEAARLVSATSGSEAAPQPDAHPASESAPLALAVADSPVRSAPPAAPPAPPAATAVDEPQVA
ncbi:MAG: hypothetical protein NZ518_06900, partial [Dehalococcoidia bacterium]|nr:hypothetical protein [Dehalococcoidia bacterium]